jgi:hypothetical protein
MVGGTRGVKPEMQVEEPRGKGRVDERDLAAKDCKMANEGNRSFLGRSYEGR